MSLSPAAKHLAASFAVAVVNRLESKPDQQFITATALVMPKLVVVDRTGTGSNRLSISVASKRGCLSSVSYLVQDVTDVDEASVSQPNATRR
jgi:hypothetical protein